MEHYKNSEANERVLSVIRNQSQEIHSGKDNEQGEPKASTIDLVDYRRDAKYPTSILRYDFFEKKSTFSVLL